MIYDAVFTEPNGVSNSVKIALCLYQKRWVILDTRLIYTIDFSKFKKEWRYLIEYLYEIVAFDGVHKYKLNKIVNFITSSNFMQRNVPSRC